MIRENVKRAVEIDTALVQLSDSLGTLAGLQHDIASKHPAFAGCDTPELVVWVRSQTEHQSYTMSIPKKFLAKLVGIIETEVSEDIKNLEEELASL